MPTPSRRAQASSEPSRFQGGEKAPLTLYLIYAEGINDAGAITGQACVVSVGVCTGTRVAFLAVPGRGHAAGAAPKVRVPAALYEEGWRRWGFRPGVTPVAAHLARPIR